VWPDDVLATPKERRVSIEPELVPCLTLDDWRHPDVVTDDRPSDTGSFRRLAEELATGNLDAYRPCRARNTHWRHWPEGGTL